MNGDLAELLNAAETGGVRNAEEILKGDEFVGANRAKCIQPSKEMDSVLTTRTLKRRQRDGTGRRSLGKTPCKLQQKKTGRIFRVQRERTYQNPAQNVSQVRLAIMQLEGKWKATMSELGGDANILDVWRMSALLEICPKDVKEQMMMRFGEIGENYSTNETEQARGRQK